MGWDTMHVTKEGLISIAFRAIQIGDGKEVEIMGGDLQLDYETGRLSVMGRAFARTGVEARRSRSRRDSQRLRRET